MPSEIENRAEEVRKLAAQCKDLQQLRQKLGWPMSSVRSAAQILDLKLPLIRATGRSKPLPPRAVPKPEAKKK